MKQLCVQLIVLLFLMISFSIVHGQSNMYIHPFYGKQSKITTTDIDKITFPGESMLIALKSKTSTNFPIPEIKYCNFKLIPDRDIEHPNYVIRIFPNPTLNEFRIESSIIIREIVMYDVLGQKLMQLTPESDIIYVQLNNYSKGIYFLQMNTHEGIFSEKIIKH